MKKTRYPILILICSTNLLFSMESTNQPLQTRSSQDRDFTTNIYRNLSKYFGTMDDELAGIESDAELASTKDVLQAFSVQVHDGTDSQSLLRRYIHRANATITVALRLNNKLHNFNGLFTSQTKDIPNIRNLLTDAANSIHKLEKLCFLHKETTLPPLIYEELQKQRELAVKNMEEFWSTFKEKAPEQLS